MSDITRPTKVCRTCNKELKIYYFNFQKKSSDGHSIHCSACARNLAKKQPSYKKYNKTGGKKWQRMNLNNVPN